jgi:hypothetical protein
MAVKVYLRPFFFQLLHSHVLVLLSTRSQSLFPTTTNSTIETLETKLQEIESRLETVSEVESVWCSELCLMSSSKATTCRLKFPHVKDFRNFHVHLNYHCFAHHTACHQKQALVLLLLNKDGDTCRCTRLPNSIWNEVVTAYLLCKAQMSGSQLHAV